MNKLANFFSKLGLILIALLLFCLAGPIACSHNSRKGTPEVNDKSAPELMRYKAPQMPGPYADPNAPVCFADSVAQVRQRIGQTRSTIYFIERDLQNLNRRLSVDEEAPTQTARATLEPE